MFDTKFYVVAAAMPHNEEPSNASRAERSRSPQDKAPASFAAAVAGLDDSAQVENLPKDATGRLPPAPSAGATSSTTDPQIMLLLTAMQQQQQTMNALLQAIAQNPHPMPSVPLSAPAAAPASVASDAEEEPFLVSSLPNPVQKSITKARLQYTDQIRKFSKSQKRVSDLTEITEALQVNDGQYPAGVKPFASAPTFLELDNELTATKTDNQVVEIRLPAKATRRQAMRIIHRTTTEMLKSIELEAAVEHLTEVRKCASKSSLTEAIESVLIEARSQDKASEIGLADPCSIEIPPGAARQLSDHFYKIAVNAVTREMSDNASKQKMREEDEAKTRDAALKADPKALLDLVIEQKISQKMPQDENAPPAEQSKDTSELLFNALQSKNGASPGAALGQNQTRNGKGKGQPGQAMQGKQWYNRSAKQATIPSYGKGKGKMSGERPNAKAKGKGKTKGKDKGKGKSTPKGKSKGRGKEHAEADTGGKGKQRTNLGKQRY